MANGDITSIKILGKFDIPGGGHTALGGASNTKTAVWGRITGVWEDTDGLNLVRYGGFGALGLTNCDVIRFDVVTVNGTYNIDEGIWIAGIGRDDENIYLAIDGGQGGAGDNPSATHICAVNFFAIGDSNAAPDLT